ncbi:MAG: hypothetical protein HC809_14025 [Gammaproteobacteria bacterium]|nr:hypothetical protein [Gammaproteobacteria bacterium]
MILSSDRVHADTRIVLTTATPQALRIALAPLGLTLESSGTLWVIVPSAAAAQSQAVHRAATAQARVTLETVIVTGTRHQLPEGLRGTSAASLAGETLHAVPALGGDSSAP